MHKDCCLNKHQNFEFTATALLAVVCNHHSR